MPGLSDPRQQAVVLLFCGGLGLLISVMLSIRAVGFDRDVTPGRRILAHWLPIVAAALLATWLGHAEVAVAIIFGTSVALLSVVSGFVAMAGPLVEIPAHSRRLWPFLPVLATLVFVLGLRGTLGLFEATALVIQGLLVLLLWTGRGSPPDAEIAAPRAGLRASQIIALILAIALAAVAAWAATRGAEIISHNDVRYPSSVIAATLFSIALALPMVSTGVAAAAEGRPAIAVSAQVGILLLNFTALLPAVILLRILIDRFLPHPTTSATAAAIAPLLYPRLAWRIDAVAILILSLLFVPIAEAKVRLDRRLGGWLIFGYCVYLLTVLVVGGKGT